MLHYHTIPVTTFAQNCSVLWCDQRMQAAVIDPGGDIALILEFLREQALTLQHIWVTHGHLDHCAGAPDLEQATGAPISGPHEGDAFWLAALPQSAANYGFPPARSFTPTRWLADGDTLQVGQETLCVRHCPGHTPGHVVFHAPQIQRVFVGDVLFAGSIGRTDFPQGNHAQLIHSITHGLWPMGDETIFIPGHGPESTLGHERRNNPFVRDA